MPNASTERKRRWRAAHREQDIERKRVFRRDHPEYMKQYREQNRDRLAVLNRDWTDKNLSKVLCDAAKKRSIKYGVPFDIAPNDIAIPDTCPILGMKLIRGTGTSQDCSPTLDRIIPERGYVKGNVAVISSLANRIKSSATYEQLELIVAWIKRADA